MVSVRQAVSATLRAARDAALARESRARFAASAGALVLSVSMSWSPHALADQAAAQAASTTSNPPAPAAASTDDSLQEITVTGSRIKRKDYESSSPLVTVDSAELEQRSGLNIESYLNQLPQYSPAQTPTTEAEDVQPSATNTVGVSTISLRGFGPNRSLVLVDGHRTTPVNALMVTDINTIPSAMIDRVETISGGASATYGADALGGVTNFILKKSFQGLQVDVQDGETQAGDGNELRVSALMGTRFADGKGNIIMGAEYYNRDASYDSNRSFYTNAWNDPNALTSNAFFINGYNGYSAQFYPPSAGAMAAAFPARTAAGGSPASFGSAGIYNNFYFNPNGSLFTQNGSIANSGYNGPTSGNGLKLQNCYDNTQLNNGQGAAPNQTQCLAWNNPTALTELPQTRFSFYGNSTYDITDDVKFFTNVRFAESQTDTLLATPTSGIGGWSASVPFNAATDSPIAPTAITPTTSAAQVSTILASLVNANGSLNTSSPYYNSGYKALGTTGVGHPVPAQLAALLLSRSVYGSGLPPGIIPGTGSGPQYGNPASCSPYIAASLCSAAPTSWDLSYFPGINAAPQRSTMDWDTSWQIETGLDFPLHISDWTGELYYSRGQSTAYQQAYGNDSLQRFQSIIQAPGYGQGLSFQGNQNSVSPSFGTSVPSTCASGMYGAIFNDSAPSSDCQAAFGSTLQTMTQMEQDVVEANFQGSIMKLPAGEMSAAVGYSFRRDSALFTPDGLQGTSSFLDETVGLYPLGALDAQQTVKDGYVELLVPLLKDTFIKELNLDLGGRYSSYNDAPNATTFKINMDGKLTDSVKVRGGFNRATRAPNLGELYLGMQEYFGSGALYGDPCSVQSKASFGAGGAAADQSTSAAVGQKVVNANGMAGAESTYLICQAQIGAVGTPGYNAYYTTQNQTSQAGEANAQGFAWINEVGNPNLQAETADTWTAGFVLSNLADNAWLGGLTASVDWWQIGINNAIEVESPDYANYLCYGTNIVTNAAQAAAQANSAACQAVPRSTTTGGQLTELTQYNNLGTIHTSGVDFGLNWFAQFSDIGLPMLPGGLAYNSQDSLLLNYYTKASPLAFDVNTNWKDSMGPTLAGTNGGAYGYRLFQTFSWVMPSFSVNLHWQFLPSINTVGHASTAAIEQYDAHQAAGSANVLAYTPDNSIAAPHYNKFDLSFSWQVNKTLQLRGGIDNLFDASPPITGATTGYAPGTNYCAGKPQGCTAPSAYALPNDGAGQTNVGFYDILGRTFFLGFKAQF
jgi:outer membrane receptor protein involved in Fe transport